MKEAAGEAEDDELGMAAGLADEREPEAHENDADVFDAVIGEEALEVVLAECEEDAENGADGSEDEDDRTPTEWGGGEERECAEEAVDSNFQDDTGEDGGDVGGCSGVCGREPEVEGHHACFEAKADEGDDEDGSAEGGAGLAGEQGAEFEGAGGEAQEGEKSEEGQGAEAGGVLWMLGTE